MCYIKAIHIIVSSLLKIVFLFHIDGAVCHFYDICFLDEYDFKILLIIADLCWIIH